MDSDMSLNQPQISQLRNMLMSKLSRNDVLSILSDYLTQSNAANTYETTAHAASTYLTQSNAANTYETTAHAASTYLTEDIADNRYETIDHADSTYARKKIVYNPDDFLTYPSGGDKYLDLYDSLKYEANTDYLFFTDGTDYTYLNISKYSKNTELYSQLFIEFIAPTSTNMEITSSNIDGTSAITHVYNTDKYAKLFGLVTTIETIDGIPYGVLTWYRI